MGSVIDDIECPNCKEEAFTDFYYKTGEEYVNCQHCGYHYSSQWKRDADGKFITKDGTTNYDFDNLIRVDNELKNPYGSFRIKYKDAVAYQCGGLVSEEELDSIKKQLENSDIEHFSVSRLIDGQIKVEKII
jgi:Zn ribbon nucleic-acid-binding protein